MIFAKLICRSFIIGLLISCNNYGQSTETPTCIEGKIREIKNEGVRNPPGSIWQYKYNGNVVYYIPAHCCDQPSELFDANCNFICSPDGGFAGNGDGKCPDFFEDRSSEKLIWKDLR